jgi:hypothetical protein
MLKPVPGELTLPAMLPPGSLIPQFHCRRQNLRTTTLRVLSPLCECGQRLQHHSGYYHACVQPSALGQRFASSGTKRRFKMKRLLILSAFLLALPIAGCTVTPTPAAQGPPGATGQTGQTGQQGDPGHAGDAGQTGDRGRTGHPGDDGHQGDQGRAGDTGEQGRTGETGDRGRQGHDAPCPAGEHRYTDRETGRVSCVRD